SRSARNHARQDGLDHACCAEEVRVKLVHELVPLGFQYGAVEVIASVVHQHVNAALAPQYLAHTRLDRLCAGDVQTEQLQAVEVIGLHLGSLRHVDAVAATLQPCGDRGTNAASAAGNEDDQGIVLHGGVPLERGAAARYSPPKKRSMASVVSAGASTTEMCAVGNSRKRPLGNCAAARRCRSTGHKGSRVPATNSVGTAMPCMREARSSRS